MATKAFEQTYINETELCEPIDFYTRVNRPDLVEEGDVEYIVLDARPASECEQPPPDRPWTSAPYLAGLILPQGSSNCRCRFKRHMLWNAGKGERWREKDQNNTEPASFKYLVRERSERRRQKQCKAMGHLVIESRETERGGDEQDNNVA